MKRFILYLTMVFTVIACSQNKITGRKQLALYNEADIQAMATQQYRQFLTEHRVVSANADKDADMVRRVGQRLATAITQYYTKQGLAKELEGFQWEYNLVDDKQVNAWCMPGGKIVVYTGLLPYTQNEAALAVVLGHEITHALAKHGNERMSQASLQQLGGVALSVAVSNRSPEAQNLLLQAYGIGSTIGGILPFSRKHELEADHFGLIYTAMSGYNPQEAIPFWQRMAKASGGQKPPEILSTHPADETRIRKLQEAMPEALKYYKPVGSK